MSRQELLECKEEFLQKMVNLDRTLFEIREMLVFAFNNNLSNQKVMSKIEDMLDFLFEKKVLIECILDDIEINLVEGDY